MEALQRIWNASLLGRLAAALCRWCGRQWAGSWSPKNRRTKTASFALSIAKEAAGDKGQDSMWRPRKPAMVWASLYWVSLPCRLPSVPAKRTQPSTSPSDRMGAAQDTR